MPELEAGEFCPFIRGACVKDQCKQWVHIRGKHPQSGAEMDFPDCAIKWMPVLLIDTAKEVRQAAAAVESFRNVAAAGMGGIGQALMDLRNVGPWGHALEDRTVGRYKGG